MLPTLTPPTDNLYKFISLFGLTIFLFAIYMLSEAFTQSTTLNVNLEKAVQEIRKSETENSIFEAQNAGIKKRKLRPFKSISDDISLVRLKLASLKLPVEKEYLYMGKLNVLELKVNFFRHRIIAYWVLLSLGVLLMIYGFVRWSKKDQRYRDEMLLVELRTKQILESYAKDNLARAISSNISSDMNCPACNKPISG